jgi:uncharacterized membrane protein
MARQAGGGGGPSVKAVAVDDGDPGAPAEAVASAEDEDVGDEEDELTGFDPGPSRRIRITALVLSLIGLADSTYLTITHFQAQLLQCSTHGAIDCLAVTTSPQSRVFGIPVAFLGLAFYVAMTAINLPVFWRTTDVRVAWIRLAMVVTGIGFVLYLIYAELFLIKAICEYCTGVHIVTFALFILVVTTFPSMLQRARGEWGGDTDWDEEPGTVTS